MKILCHWRVPLLLTGPFPLNPALQKVASYPRHLFPWVLKKNYTEKYANFYVRWTCCAEFVRRNYRISVLTLPLPKKYILKPSKLSSHTTWTWFYHRAELFMQQQPHSGEITSWRFLSSICPTSKAAPGDASQRQDTFSPWFTPSWQHPCIIDWITDRLHIIHAKWHLSAELKEDKVAWQ